MKKDSYIQSAKLFAISFLIIALIIISQIPIIKTYLNMIDFSTLKWQEIIVIVCISTMVYVLAEIIYNKSKK